MNKTGCRVVCRIFAGLGLMVMATTGFAEEPLVLATNGQTDYKIVISVNAPKAIEYAAQELGYFLKEMTGAEFPIRSDATPVGTDEIVLGETSRLALEDIPEAFRPTELEGYAIIKKEKNLFVIGQIPRATLYGVYDVLEEMGVRFLTQKTTHIPNVETLTYAIVSRKYDPPLEYRNVYSYVPTELERKWAVRNKLNAMWVAPPMRKVLGGCEYLGFAHTLPKLLPHKEYFEEHPEYFALIDGERREKMYPTGSYESHPCLINKEVKKIVIANIRKIIARHNNHPNLYHPDSLLVVPIDYTDHSQICQCSACQLVNKEEGTKGGTLYRFVSEIAAELEDEYPNVTFSTFAYSQMIDPPKTVTFGKNVSIRYAPIYADFGRAFDDPKSETNVKTLKDLTAWSKMTSRLHVWDYVTNFKSYIVPHPNLRAISRDFKTFSTLGIKGVFAESSQYPGSALRELRHYLLAQLMWCPDADAQKIINEFCQFYYGEGSTGVLDYIDYLHDYHITTVDPDGDNPLTAYGAPRYGNSYSLEFIDEADAILDKAEKEAVTEEEKFHVAVARLPIWYLRLENAMNAEGETISLPVEWNFKLDEKSVGLEEKWFEIEDFSGWDKIRTDNFWTKQGYDYHGVAWYATSFDLSDALPRDGSFALSFGAVDGYCDVFVDGKKIGEQMLPPTQMWNQGFFIPLKSGLAEGHHTLAVRVKETYSAAGIWKRVSLQNLGLPVAGDVKIVGLRFIEVSKEIGLDAITTSYGKTGAINKYYGRIRALLNRKSSNIKSSENASILKDASMIHSCHNTYFLVEDTTASSGYCQKQTAEKKWTMGQSISWNITKHLEKAEENGRSYRLRVRIKVEKTGDEGFAFCFGHFYYKTNETGGSWCTPSIWVKGADVENGEWKWNDYPHLLTYKKDSESQHVMVWAQQNPDNINAIYVDRFELVPITNNGNDPEDSGQVPQAKSK